MNSVLVTLLCRECPRKYLLAFRREKNVSVLVSGSIEAAASGFCVVCFLGIVSPTKWPPRVPSLRVLIFWFVCKRPPAPEVGLNTYRCLQVMQGLRNTMLPYLQWVQPTVNVAALKKNYLAHNFPAVRPACPRLRRAVRSMHNPKSTA